MHTAKGVFWVTGLETKVKQICRSELPEVNENRFYEVLLYRISDNLLNQQFQVKPILDGYGVKFHDRRLVGLILSDPKISIDQLTELVDIHNPDRIIFLRRPTYVTKNRIIKFAQDVEITFATFTLPDIDYRPNDTERTVKPDGLDLPGNMISMLQNPDQDSHTSSDSNRDIYVNINFEGPIIHQNGNNNNVNISPNQAQEKKKKAVKALNSLGRISENIICGVLSNIACQALNNLIG